MASTSKEMNIKTEEVNKNLNVAKLEDINNKMITARRILHACEYENKNDLNHYLENIHERTIFYIAQDSSMLVYKAKKIIKHDRNLNSYLKEQGESPSTDLSYKRYILRDIIMDFYISRRHIPSMSSLLHELKKRCLVRSHYGKKLLISDVKTLGFTWTPLLGTDKIILVDNPEQAIKTQRYLQQMASYRSAGRNFIYIDEINYSNFILNNTYELNTPYLTITGGRDGQIKVLFDVTCKDNFLVNCLYKNILPQAPPGSVIVMTDKKYHTKTTPPNEFSPKCEMSDWLKKNNIPHDRKSHRADIYRLIQRSKGKSDEESCVDAPIQAQGHDIIHCPPGILQLNYFMKFIEKVNKNREYSNSNHSFKNYVIRLKDTYTKADWERFEEELIIRERKVYEQSMQFEIITDQLLTMAKDKNISEEDLLSLKYLDTELPLDQLLSDVIHL